MARVGDLGRFCRNHSLLPAAGSPLRAATVVSIGLEEMTVPVVPTVPTVPIVPVVNAWSKTNGMTYRHRVIDRSLCYRISCGQRIDKTKKRFTNKGGQAYGSRQWSCSRDRRCHHFIGLARNGTRGSLEERCSGKIPLRRSPFSTPQSGRGIPTSRRWMGSPRTNQRNGKGRPQRRGALPNVNAGSVCSRRCRHAGGVLPGL